MKRIVIALILLPMILLTTTCNLLDDYVKQPEVSFNSVKVSPGTFTLQGITLDCNVTITNPNTFDIPDLPDTYLELYVNGNFFIGSALPIGGGIKAKKAADFVIPVTIQFVDFFKSFVSLWKQEKIDIRVAMEIIIPLDYDILDMFKPNNNGRSIDLDGLLGEEKIVKWNIEKSSTLPLPQLPKLTSSFKLEKPNLLNGLGATVSMNFNNPNPFDLPAPKITFDYKMSGVSLLQSTTQATAIAASKTTTIGQTLNIPWTEIILKIPSFILSPPKSVNTTFDFDCDFGLKEYGDSVLKDVLSSVIPTGR